MLHECQAPEPKLLDLEQPVGMVERLPEARERHGEKRGRVSAGY